MTVKAPIQSRRVRSPDPRAVRKAIGYRRVAYLRYRAERMMDMPFLEINDILTLLSCPACGEPLTGPADSLTCSSPTWRRGYPVVGKRPTPILIDTDTSIADVAALLKTDGVSQIGRGG